MPNAGHDLREKQPGGNKTLDRALATLTVFGRRAASGKAMPKLDWKHAGEDTNATLTVQAEPAPARVVLWKVAAATQDFRKAEWKSEEMALSGGKAAIGVDMPAGGAVAFYALAEFNDDLEPYWLATQVRVIEAGK